MVLNCRSPSPWHCACVPRRDVATLLNRRELMPNAGLSAPPAAVVAPLGSPPPKPTVGFHGAVSEFKRRLIEATLAQAGGNRTRAAKALGLQRTYLLRLMREFEIRIPPSAPLPARS